jgi:hypothetical protein
MCEVGARWATRHLVKGRRKGEGGAEREWEHKQRTVQYSTARLLAAQWCAGDAHSGSDWAIRRHSSSSALCSRWMAGEAPRGVRCWWAIEEGEWAGHRHTTVVRQLRMVCMIRTFRQYFCGLTLHRRRSAVRGGWHAGQRRPGEEGGTTHTPPHVSKNRLCCAADAPFASTCVSGSHRLLGHVGAASPQRVPMIKITNTGLASGVRAPAGGAVGGRA